MEKGELFYTIPEMIKHPNQKYTAKRFDIIKKVQPFRIAPFRLFKTQRFT